MFTVQMVNSTAIKLVAYNYSERILRVVFRNNRGYDFEGVDEEIFEWLANAESVGTEFQKLGLRSLPCVRLSCDEVMDFLIEVVRQSDRVLVQC